MKYLYLLLLLFSSVIYADAKVELTTHSDYQTQAFVYDGNNNNGIIFLHGKKGNPKANHNVKFIDKITAKGYTLIAPIMPWSEKRGYEGTRKQGYEIIDEAIKTLHTEKIVIIGHSMGAIAALQYAAQNNKKVIGIVAIAPAHDPNIAQKLRSITQNSANTACAQVDIGNSKDKNNFAEMNMGKEYSIYASNEYYCSYYNTKYYPNTFDVINTVNIPVFILSGDQDRLTKVYSHKKLFDALPKHNLNTYKKLSGKHKSVLFKYIDEVDDWMSNLE